MQIITEGNKKEFQNMNMKKKTKNIPNFVLTQETHINAI